MFNRKMAITMKKNYIQPETFILCVEESLPIATSGATSNKGIGWGGFDKTGSKEADAIQRRFNTGF